jgi:hypothetical protein
MVAMSKVLKIDTASGRKTVVQRAGVAGDYYYTLPAPNAPNGEWWTLNPQRGYVSVPSNSRGLMAALAGEVSL